MITASVLFVVLTAIAFFLVMGDLVNDWIDDTIWAVANRREYRRITAANPHLRPETLAQMTRRAWQERQRASS